jgi:hypothetical protein
VENWADWGGEVVLYRSHDFWGWGHSCVIFDTQNEIVPLANLKKWLAMILESLCSLDCCAP